MNFNTVYFEPRTYQIAAWIQIKMYFITILFLSVFHSSLCEYFLYMNLFIKQTLPHRWSSSGWEVFEINQQNKHRQLEKTSTSKALQILAVLPTCAVCSGWKMRRLSEAVFMASGIAWKWITGWITGASCMSTFVRSKKRKKSSCSHIQWILYMQTLGLLFVM